MTKTGLEFGIFSHSSRFPHESKTPKAPSGGRSALGPLQLFQLLVKARRDQVLKLFAQVALIVLQFKANNLPKFK